MLFHVRFRRSFRSKVYLVHVDSCSYRHLSFLLTGITPSGALVDSSVLRDYNAMTTLSQLLPVCPPPGFDLLVRYVDQLAFFHNVPVVEVTFKTAAGEILDMQHVSVLASTRKSLVLQQDEKSNEIIKVGPAELIERETHIHAVVDNGPNIRKLVQAGVVEGLQDGALRFVKLEGLGEPLEVKHVENMASLFDQASAALQHLHKNSVLHRDIKPSNMIIIGGQLKLNDFDCSCFTNSKECKDLRVGTSLFSSPYLSESYVFRDDWAALVLSFLHLRMSITDKKAALQYALKISEIPETIKSCIVTHFKDQTARV
jgi:serine/threonine protein kinase